jgi:hypothetical protein
VSGAGRLAQFLSPPGQHLPPSWAIERPGHDDLVRRRAFSTSAWKWCCKSPSWYSTVKRPSVRTAVWMYVPSFEPSGTCWTIRK